MVGREKPREGADAEAAAGERRGDGFGGSIGTVPENGEVTVGRALGVERFVKGGGGLVGGHRVA